LELDQIARFEAVALPHLDAAYTLARYLMRDPHDADDVVQDAYLRALRHFDTYQGGDARAWVLAIVRNVCHSRFSAAAQHRTEEFLEEEHESAEATDAAALRADTRETLREALDSLPPEFREAVVLREIQGLSYQEIAGIVKAPIGTVMSRIARGRARLEKALTRAKREGHL
jgi:RNA polymerase sigma-70 factor, ECF subfamily